MKNKDQQSRPRQRLSQRSSSKVPLTYYRSGESSAATTSPFRKKPAQQPTGLRLFLSRILDGLIILIFLAGLVYSLMVKPDPKVIISSNAYHSKDIYEAAAQKYLGSVKNRNKITLNVQNVSESLKKQFPEIAEASVELPILDQTPIIHINVARPSFVLQNGHESYIVDSQGVAVGKSQSYPSINNLTTVIDRSGFRAGDGQQVMSADSVKFITTLTAQLRQAKVPVASITLPPLAQQLELRTKDKPYFVKFYLGGDPLQQAGQFLAIRHSDTQPTQYLDVRVPGKVFYK